MTAGFRQRTDFRGWRTATIDITYQQILQRRATRSLARINAGQPGHL